MILTIVFRVINDEVVAFFPTLPHRPDCMAGYAHDGQHFEASLDYYSQGRGIPATEAQYKDLLKEIRSIYEPKGYELKVQNWPHGWSTVYDENECKAAPHKRAHIDMKKHQFLNLDMDLFYKQKLMLVDLAAKAEAEGYHHLAYQLDGVLGVFDAVQDAAEEDGSFTPPVADEDTGRFADEDYNDVLKKILDADAKTTKKREM